MRDRIPAVFSSLLYFLFRRLLGMLSCKDRAAEQVRLENLVLHHQVAILRRQVKRPVYRMHDRALLAAASRMLPRERWSVFLVRPALDPDIRRLILRLAKENPRWGYVRIKSELQGLGIFVSATAIPCDFFTVETALLKTLYVHFFIEIGSRRVRASVSTSNPDSVFVTQQARNLAMSLFDEGAITKVLIRDRDAQFSRSFDDVLASEGIRVIRTPIRAPNANAFAERWVETLRTDRLDWTLILGPGTWTGFCGAT